MQVVFSQDEAPKEMFILQTGVIIVTTLVTADGSDPGNIVKGTPDHMNTITEKVSAGVGVFPMCKQCRIDRETGNSSL